MAKRDSQSWRENGKQVFDKMATAPLMAWLEFAKQWQKFWADRMARANRR
jgi:hypothetical protein